MTPADVLAAAERLLDETTAGRARMAAFVARQALEQSIDGRLRALGAQCLDATMRSKLVILCALGDPTEADMAEQAWSRLSVICHHHTYELEPAVSDVRDLCTTTSTLVSS